MSEPLQPLTELLRSHGQSLTRPRKTVFEQLRHQEPQTMHELVLRCDDIDRASVYRTVALFERLGVVQRLHTGWKYKLELTEQFQEHHHHATCMVCGTTLVLPEDEALEKRLRLIAAKAGFAVERHQVELQGYCTYCKSLR